MTIGSLLDISSIFSYYIGITILILFGYGMLKPKRVFEGQNPMDTSDYDLTYIFGLPTLDKPTVRKNLCM
jgi:hypothetical protein